MNDELYSWLPDLILLQDFKGNWNSYIDMVYQAYHEDFVKKRPLFQKTPIFVRYHPSYEEKGATFWHLVSEGIEESERIPDLRRCERIRWPKSMIEKANSGEVRVWESMRPWKGQVQRRINFALRDFSYIVVIAETSKGFTLVTAYHLEKIRRREKLKKEYEIFSEQKKEGSVV